MAQLNSSTISELESFFRNQEYTSKCDLVNTTDAQIRHILSLCDFVYVSENGKVIHSNRFCGTGLNSPVHIGQAVKHGYRQLCTKCANTQHMQLLLEKYLYE